MVGQCFINRYSMLSFDQIHGNVWNKTMLPFKLSLEWIGIRILFASWKRTRQFYNHLNKNLHGHKREIQMFETRLRVEHKLFPIIKHKIFPIGILSYFYCPYNKKAWIFQEVDCVIYIKTKISTMPSIFRSIYVTNNELEHLILLFIYLIVSSYN